MGFGKSETPVDREYTLGTHVENLEALLLELNLREKGVRPQGRTPEAYGDLRLERFDAVC
jgi:hypothetical protein